MTPVKQTELQQIREEARQLAAPLIPRIKVLKIMDAQTLAEADTFLDKIATARKSIKGRIKRILDPLNEARREILGLQTEMDSPLESLETQLRIGMMDFREAEQRKLLEAQQERDRQERERLKAARELEIKAANAKSDVMRKRLEAQRREQETQAEIIAATPIAAPIAVAHSTLRVIKKVRVDDKAAFLAAIAAGKIPDDVVTIEEGVMNRYLKVPIARVETWPGCSIYEETTVVRK